MITLRFFPPDVFLQVIRDAFGWTIFRIVRRVFLALAAKHETFITFPTTNEVKQQVKLQCTNLRVFPASLDVAIARISEFIPQATTNQTSLTREGTTAFVQV